jgi:hypothetical protein
LSTRKEYFQKYYQEHKQDIIKRSLEDYENNRKEHLTYAKKYYILNRDMILAKLKKTSTEFIGHAHLIYKAIRKYAKQWDLNCSPWDEFREWTSKDPGYEELFAAWKESGHDGNLSPVVMRGVKKNGFVVDNLKWDVKKNYSWWNEDHKIFQEVEQNLDKQQKERNVRDKAWRKRVREEWKAKKKKDK